MSFNCYYFRLGFNISNWKCIRGFEKNGSNRRDKLYGGPDSDILQDGQGSDLLLWCNGDDELYGGAGDDVSIGGKRVNFFDCRNENGIIIDFDLDKINTQSGRFCSIKGHELIT